MRTPSRPLLVAGAAALAVAGLGGGALLVLGDDDAARGPATREAAAESLARRTAEQLVGLSAEDAEETVADLRATAAGPWAEQLGARPEQLVTLARATGAVLDSGVDAVALGERTPTSWTYLVATSATLEDTGEAASPAERTYLLQVRVEAPTADAATGDLRVTAVEVTR